MPLNTDGLRAGVSASYLDYENVGKFAFPVNQGGGFGRAQTIGVNLTYPLLRSPAANSNLTAGLDRKNYLNKQQRDGSHTSEYRIDNFVLGFSANRYDSFAGGGVTQGGVTMTKGHLVFGSENPSTYGRYTPTTFTKFNLNLSRTQQIVPDETVLNVNLSAQISSVDLDSAEKFYLGGPYGVRGYPGSQGGGSQGAMINIEIQQALEDKVIASIFYDAGVVQQYIDKYAFVQMKGRIGPDTHKIFSSLGFGLNEQIKIWSGLQALPGNWATTHFSIIWVTVSIMTVVLKRPIFGLRCNGCSNETASCTLHYSFDCRGLCTDLSGCFAHRWQGSDGSGQY